MEENRRRNIHMIPGKLSYLHLASNYILKMVTANDGAVWYSLLEQPKTFLNAQQQKKIQSHSNTQPWALKSHTAQLKPKQNVPYMFHDHVLQTSHPTNPGGGGGGVGIQFNRQGACCWNRALSGWWLPGKGKLTDATLFIPLSTMKAAESSFAWWS